MGDCRRRRLDRFVQAPCNAAGRGRGCASPRGGASQTHGRVGEPPPCRVHPMPALPHTGTSQTLSAHGRIPSRPWTDDRLANLVRVQHPSSLHNFKAEACRPWAAVSAAQHGALLCFPIQSRAMPSHARIFPRDLPEAFENAWTTSWHWSVGTPNVPPALPVPDAMGTGTCPGRHDNSPFHPPRFHVPASSIARMKQQMAPPMSPASCCESSLAVHIDADARVTS